MGCELQPHAAINVTPWLIDDTPAPMYVLTGMLIGPFSPRGLYQEAASHTCVPGGTSGPITMSRLVRDVLRTNDQPTGGIGRAVPTKLNSVAPCADSVNTRELYPLSAQ